MKEMRTVFKMLLALPLSLTLISASCSKPDTPVDENEKPPHQVDKEQEQEDIDVEPTITKASGVTRLVSYNIGAFNKYTNSITMVAKMMKELDADAVGLNEVDSCTTRTGKVYQLKELAGKMGDWHYYYGRAMPYQGGAYGNGIIMSPKLKNTGTHLIPLPKGSGSEPRSCAVIKTDKFIYLATHLEVRNEESRLEGVRLITEWAKSNYGNSDVPVFLCGDMNCEPKDAPIQEFQKNWTLLSVTKNTYPSRGSTKCIDFIFALNNKAEYELVGSDVPLNFKHGSVTDASDHLPVYVDVKLK